MLVLSWHLECTLRRAPQIPPPSRRGWDMLAGSFSENCLQWGEPFYPSHYLLQGAPERGWKVLCPCLQVEQLWREMVQLQSSLQDQGWLRPLLPPPELSVSLCLIWLPSQVLSWGHGCKPQHTNLHLSIWNRLSNERVKERKTESSSWDRNTALFLWAWKDVCLTTFQSIKEDLTLNSPLEGDECNCIHPRMCYQPVANLEKCHNSPLDSEMTWSVGETLQGRLWVTCPCGLHHPSHSQHPHFSLQPTGGSAGEGSKLWLLSEWREKVRLEHRGQGMTIFLLFSNGKVSTDHFVCGRSQCQKPVCHFDLHFMKSPWYTFVFIGSSIR